MDVNGIFSSGGVGETLRINSPVASRQNRSFLLDRLGSSGVTHTPTSNAPRMTIAEARDGLGAASAELTRALRALSNETRPVYTYSTTTRGPVMAIARGASARLADTGTGAYSTLQTTVAVNTQTSTEQSSSSVLGLDVDSPETQSTIASTDEINAETNSYDSSEQTFGGTGQQSTSTGALTGEYTGINAAAAAESLEFTILANATVTTSTAVNVQFEVRDQAWNLLFTFNGDIKAGDSVYLGDDIGLSISFLSGSLRKNQYFSTNVGHQQIDIDENAIFNASDPADRSQFENGAQVTAGSFTVNGVTIDVYADDTIEQVKDRITDSGAGVTASFENERLTLTSDDNSEDAIVLANDTSGFLSATKLSGATTVTGNLKDDRQVFSKTTQFNAVTDGTFSINGTSIAIDADQDTLATVIDKINNSGTGVAASYDSGSDQLLLSPGFSGAPLSLEDDTSGFLAAANIATGHFATQVNADAAFNGTALNAPMFDPGHVVSAGSFTVNGVTITVDAADSVNTVLAKITASAAGVTASYDDASQIVTLTATNQSTDPITVGSDTSGFLAAVKLDGSAVSTPGAPTSISAFAATLDTMAEYSSVQTGTLTVNGQQISIDPTSTTINNVVAAINGIENVSATLNQSTGAISIESTAIGVDITLSDTSGLLSTLDISADTYTGSRRVTNVVETRTESETVSNAKTVTTDVEKAVATLNESLAHFSTVADADGRITEIGDALRRATQVLSEAGIEGLSFSANGSQMNFSLDTAQLERTLAQDKGSLAAELDRFAEMLAEAAKEPEAEAPDRLSLLQVGSTIQSQQFADLAAGALTLSGPSQRESQGAGAFWKAVEAYSENSRSRTQEEDVSFTG